MKRTFFRQSERVVVLVLALSVLVFNAAAVTDSLRSQGLSFRDVPVSQGLSQSSVYCMLQDHKGFIWIGTKDGLNRYDGYEFVTYKYDQTDPNSLSNNEITCLENDNNKYLWIGTRSGGINRLEFSTGNITRFDNLTYDGLVQSLLVDSLDNLWAGTSEGLLLFPPDEEGERNMTRNLSETASYYDSEGRIFDPGNKHISVTSMVEIARSVLLVGTEEGLFLYDIDKNSFTSISPETLDITVFTDLVFQEDTRDIWAASYEGLFKISSWDGREDPRVISFDTAARDKRRLPVDWTENIAVDREENVWVGTRGGGLLRIEDDEISGHFRHNTSKRTSVPDDLINSLMIDRTGILWIGTESRGLGYSDLQARSFYNLMPGDDPNSLSDDLVTAISGNDSRLWIGTAAEGIDVFEHQEDKVLKQQNIPRVEIGNNQSSREIMALLCDEDDDLWIGSATNSLTVYNKEEGFKSFVVNGFVFSLLQDTYGHIWYGTWGHGLGYIEKDSGHIESYYGNPALSLGLSSDKVLSVFQDTNDLLWVGTKGGGVNVCPIDRVIDRTGEFVEYRNVPGESASLSYNDVYDVAEDRDGNIWIATGSGLNKVEVEGEENLVDAVEEEKIKFTSYSEKDGLSGGLVLFIEEDADGHLWLGTNKGVSRFDPDEEDFINYGINDGLPSGELHVNSSFRDEKTGRLYFGGVDGVTIFHPDSLKANPFPSKVQITSLMLHNQTIHPGDKFNNRRILEKDITYTDHLSLSHSNNELSFEFSALHFSNSEKITYAYRLKGFNDDWQETGSDNRRATYTNLREGDYVFEVRATNNDESWSSHVARLPLTVKPPIWRTDWAYLFYFLVLVLLLLTFRKYSLIGVKQKNRLIIESLEHKKDRELTEAKMRFFTNISHEIRTPLTLIHAPLQEILKREDIKPGIRRSLLVMHRNVKRLLNMVNQLLEFRKIDSGHLKPVPVRFNLRDLCLDTVFAFRSLADQKKIKTAVDAEDEVFVNADEKMVSTAVYNLLSNAFKFTPAGGEVSVRMEKNTEHLSGEDREMVIIRVCDTGPGIPETSLSHIFERFSRVDAEDQKHLAGSGIGLSIVKEFVELNGGSVEVYNLAAGGCCFEIRLPVDASGFISESDDSKRPSHPEGLDEEKENVAHSEEPVLPTLGEGEKTEEDAAHKPSVCIIEDDAELAQWLEDLFSKTFKTYVFHDGKEAYSKLTSLMPDILICDVMLPGMSGTQLCRRTKSRVETSHIPVVLLTARSGEENVLEGLKTGADSYMTKPFNIDILKAQVDSLLNSRAAFRRKFSERMSFEPSETSITPVDEKFLNRLMELIEEKMGDTAFDVSVLVDDMHMSHSIILKKVKALTGYSLVEFIRSMRIKRAAQIFRQDKLSVSEVSFMVGFSDPKYFSKCFSKEMGQKPTDFIKMHHGE